ncbi:MAG: class II aldolase/adducin family protein, partial [Verrucomicrobia bacterium]|nr:class II aldolase/adducin family protein [Verrucomicrobiota bacterium]
MRGLLDSVAALSKEFGVERYVLGGGGNTSVKDGDQLWVKPSGGLLKSMRADGFVGLDQSRIAALFDAPLPSETQAREAAVRDWMAGTVIAGSKGRPSVEAPLHSILPGRYVVHTHPALVNGMTCARDGAAACGRLFPDALWIDYVDPGFTLSAYVRKEVARFMEARGRAPSVILLQNHGIFVC